MSFNEENKVSWEELAPSTQELFKQLQSQIETERSQRIAGDNKSKADINSVINRINQRLKKFDDLKIQVNSIQNKLGTYFDDQGRLTFPNGDKFWIG